MRHTLLETYTVVDCKEAVIEERERERDREGCGERERERVLYIEFFTASMVEEATDEV